LVVVVRESGRSSKHRTVLEATPRFQITPCTDYWIPAFAGMTTEIVFPACTSANRPGPTRLAARIAPSGKNAARTIKRREILLIAKGHGKRRR
jgi:hypothetical protein